MPETVDLEAFREQWLVDAAAMRFSIGAGAVHAYLLRATKAKEVERDGDSYRLPQLKPDELSLQPPASEAAQ